MLTKMKRLSSVKGFTLIELMVVVAIIGIILAIAVPYYISYKRTSCDVAASGDVRKLSATVERLNTELSLMGCSDVDFATLDLAWFVGPYYGWGGTTRKCDVRVQKDTTTTSLVNGCAMNGSRPSTTAGVRLVYQVNLGGGGDLPVKQLACAGVTYGGIGSTCYTSSMVNSLTCAIQAPAGTINCASVTTQ